MSEEKTRYTDAELEEFRQIINEKLEKAQRDYDLLRMSLNNQDGNDVADTSPTFGVSFIRPPSGSFSTHEANKHNIAPDNK